MTAAPAGGRSRTASISLAVIAVVTAGAALFVAQEIFIPVALGLLFTALFRPVVRVLSEARVPPPLTATVVVLGCLGLLGGGLFFLSRPVGAWVNEAPKTLAAARGKLDKLRRPIKQVSQAVQKAQEQVTGEEKSSEGKSQQSQAPPPTANGAGISAVAGRVFATTAGILGTLLQTVVIVFLVLATGDLLNRKLADIMPRPVTGTAVQTIEQAESVVRRYLVVTALINLGQGVLVALAMWLIGLPSPPLWGALTFICEFLPYIGALFMVIALAVTGLATFDSIGHILLAPAAYIVISTIQNNAVSPFAYGSGLKLNPLAVLLSVLVGWFLWGVAGAFVAVPALAAVRIFAERSSRDSKLAAILSE
ncbi:MAG TPA: AI-2E family transporter [Gemmatimonadales bacterium]